jgi:hypothetical protein
VRCASAGAERPKCGLRADPAYVAIPPKNSILHYALPGWDAAAERRDAQDEFHSAAQARAWADGDFDADHGFAFDGVGARPNRGGGGGCARAIAVYKPPPPPKKKKTSTAEGSKYMYTSKQNHGTRAGTA